MTHLATPSSSTAEVPAISRRRWGGSRCGYRANRLMLWLGVRFLPLAYVFVALAALYFLFTAPAARRASMAYLDRIHRQPRGLLRRWCQTYRHLLEFGRLLLDRAIMLTTPRHGYTVTCQGRPHLLEALDRQRGLLLLTAHFGNGESAIPYLRHIGITRQIHLVMYQDPTDPTERFHSENRHQLKDLPIISTTDPLTAGLKIINALRSGDIVAIRADRTLAGRSLPATLLGDPIELPAGPFLAAALTGAPVLHVYTCRLAYRKYVCLISPAHTYSEETPGTRDDRTARAAADYAASLEKILRQYPRQWSNFYDFWQPHSPI